MKRIWSAVKRFVREEEGQGNTEYIILIGCLALGAIAAVIYFRNAIVSAFHKAGSWLRSAF